MYLCPVIGVVFVGSDKQGGYFGSSGSKKDLAETAYEKPLASRLVLSSPTQQRNPLHGTLYFDKVRISSLEIFVTTQ